MALLIKNLNGLAYASVKSRNGLAVASIKNINGLDATAGGGGPSLVAHTVKGGTSGGVTSDAIDTTGADFLVISISFYNGIEPNPTIADSKGNSWSALTGQAHSIISNRLYYCVPTTVGSGHTFSVTGFVYPSICVAAFSGVHATPFDVQNGGTVGSGGTTVQPGSVTPSQNFSLIIAGLGHEDNSGGAISINSGFTITDSIATSAGNYEGGAMAYLVQSSASAINPTWTSASAWNTYGAQATIAAFKPV